MTTTEIITKDVTVRFIQGLSEGGRRAYSIDEIEQISLAELRKALEDKVKKEEEYVDWAVDSFNYMFS